MIDLYSLWGKLKDDQTAESAQSLSGNKKKEKAKERANLDKEEEMTTLTLTHLVIRMREQREADVSPPATAKPMAVNKMLERTQAAG